MYQVLVQNGHLGLSLHHTNAVSLAYHKDELLITMTLFFLHFFNAETESFTYLAS